MKFSREEIDNLKELQSRMISDFHSFKNICRSAMNRSEYDLFRYRTCGHIEPVLSEDHEWVTRFSSITSLEKVIIEAEESLNLDENETEEDELDSELDEE